MVGGDSDFELSRQPGPGEAFSRFAVGKFADNALAIPDLAVTAGARLLTGQPMFDREIEGVDPKLNQGMPLPKLGERVLPIPRVEDLAAGARAIPGILEGKPPGEAFQAGQQDQTAYDESLREAHPFASGAGEISGDIATLLSGRAGGRALKGKPAQGIPTSRALVPYIEPGLRKYLDEITQKVVASKLPRGLSRAAETGLEGAVLAVLDEGDPVQTAALAAGSQAAGSLFLTMAKPLVSSTPRLLSTIALGTVAIQWFKQATPGGQDRSLESFETAVFKVLPTVLLGSVAAAAGFGRVSGPLKENLPKIADAITGIPRGALVSVIEDLSKDETGETTKVLETFTADPGAYGPGAMLRLQKALDEGSFGQEVRALMEIPEFAQMVTSGEE
jgi:hypothetical protein